MGQAYFVTGTDTEVGKTCAAAALLYAWRQRGRTVAAMKPIASGCRNTAEGLRNADAEMLLAECSTTHSYGCMNPYAFEPPIAPHIAAAEAGVTIEIDPSVRQAQQLAEGTDRFVVEGVGGWRVPLGGALTTADLAVALAYPVIVVVGIRLGCINHALLTLESIGHRELPIAGWIANEVDPECARIDDIIETIGTCCAAPLLGRIPHLTDSSPARVATHLSLPDSIS